MFFLLALSFAEECGYGVFMAKYSDEPNWVVTQTPTYKGVIVGIKGVLVLDSLEIQSPAFFKILYGPNATLSFRFLVDGSDVTSQVSREPGELYYASTLNSLGDHIPFEFTLLEPAILTFLEFTELMRGRDTLLTSEENPSPGLLLSSSLPGELPVWHQIPPSNRIGYMPQSLTESLYAFKGQFIPSATGKWDWIVTPGGSYRLTVSDLITYEGESVFTFPIELEENVIYPFSFATTDTWIGKLEMRVEGPNGATGTWETCDFNETLTEGTETSEAPTNTTSFSESETENFTSNHTTTRLAVTGTERNVLSAGVVAGIVIAVFVVVASIIVSAFILRSRKRGQKFNSVDPSGEVYTDSSS
jgi:hypothetical protein